MADTGYSGHSERQFPVLKAIEGSTEASAAALESILAAMGMGGGTRGGGAGSSGLPSAFRTGSGFGGMVDTSLADSSRLEQIRKDDLQAFLHGKKTGGASGSGTKSEADDFFDHVSNWKPTDKGTGAPAGGGSNFSATLWRSAGTLGAAKLASDIFAGGDGGTTDALGAHEAIFAGGGSTAVKVANLPANTYGLGVSLGVGARMLYDKFIGSGFGDH